MNASGCSRSSRWNLRERIVDSLVRSPGMGSTPLEGGPHRSTHLDDVHPSVAWLSGSSQKRLPDPWLCVAASRRVCHFGMCRSDPAEYRPRFESLLFSRAHLVRRSIGPITFLGRQGHDDRSCRAIPTPWSFFAATLSRQGHPARCGSEPWVTRVWWAVNLGGSFSQRAAGTGNPRGFSPPWLLCEDAL